MRDGGRTDRLPDFNVLAHRAGIVKDRKRDSGTLKGSKRPDKDRESTRTVQSKIERSEAESQTNQTQKQLFVTTQWGAG